MLSAYHIPYKSASGGKTRRTRESASCQAVERLASNHIFPYPAHQEEQPADHAAEEQRHRPLSADAAFPYKDRGDGTGIAAPVEQDGALSTGMHDVRKGKDHHHKQQSRSIKDLASPKSKENHDQEKPWEDEIRLAPPFPEPGLYFNKH